MEDAVEGVAELLVVLPQVLDVAVQFFELAQAAFEWVFELAAGFLLLGHEPAAVLVSEVGFGAVQRLVDLGRDLIEAGARSGPSGGGG